MPGETDPKDGSDWKICRDQVTHPASTVKQTDVTRPREKRISKTRGVPSVA